MHSPKGSFLKKVGVIGFEPTTLWFQSRATGEFRQRKHRVFVKQWKALHQRLHLRAVALESQTFATFDPQLSRLLALFSVGDAAQRTAILAVAEAIAPTSCKSQSNATESGATQKVLHNGLGK